VANVTWVDPRLSKPEEPGALLAFDTGPGNALINDFVSHRTGEAFDDGGAYGLAGSADGELVERAMEAAYFVRPSPKSLDRDDFVSLLEQCRDLTLEDGCATLSAVTVAAVRKAETQMPCRPEHWYVCGGGRKNACIMRDLDQELEGTVAQIEELGFDGDMIEAQAFAYLAVRVLRGLPTSSPTTTGCDRPVSGGKLSDP
jgi:anhydro-N-acetylmuramic acid kinase